MLGLLPLFCAALAAPLALASPVRARTPYAVKETHYLPRQWKHVARAPDHHVINLKIGLKQGDFNELERHLYEGKKPTQTRQ